MKKKYTQTCISSGESALKVNDTMSYRLHDVWQVFAFKTAVQCCTQKLWGGAKTAPLVREIWNLSWNIPGWLKFEKDKKKKVI